MTDEEMAEKYAKGLCKTCKVDVCRYSKIKTCTTKESLKQAYLAGLKAGKDMAEADLATIAYMQGAERYKTKWHDLRKDPNDLPKKDERFCTNISVAVITQSCGFAVYSFDDEKWYFQGKVIDVIAWCEIPTFEE